MTRATEATEATETQGAVAAEAVRVRPMARSDAFMLWWLGSPDTKITAAFIARFFVVAIVVIGLIEAIVSAVLFIVLSTVGVALGQLGR